MTKKSDSPLTMNTDLNNAFSLVKGTFDNEEAQEMLMALIESKISFHSIKNLRSFEQSGETNHSSNQRIKELENMRKEVLEIIKKAKETDRQLEIDSTIKISFANDSAVS